MFEYTSFCFIGLGFKKFSINVNDTKPILYKKVYSSSNIV